MPTLKPPSPRCGPVSVISCSKPFRANQILGAAARTLDRKYLRPDNTLLRHALRARRVDGPLLGRSAPVAEVRTMLDRPAPLPKTVLFTGATGTGKDLAARQWQMRSTRVARPFVAINCATIPPERMVEEIFGREAARCLGVSRNRVDRRVAARAE